MFQQYQHQRQIDVNPLNTDTHTETHKREREPLVRCTFHHWIAVRGTFCQRLQDTFATVKNKSTSSSL